MDQPLNEALTLMVVGMITVFVILSLVVVLGKILILLINKFFPEETVSQAPSFSTKGNTKKIAAITATVEFLTGGKGKITNIRKLD